MSQAEVNTCTLKAQYAKQMEDAERELMDIEEILMDLDAPSEKVMSYERKMLGKKFFKKQQNNKKDIIADCSKWLLELKGMKLDKTVVVSSTVAHSPERNGEVDSTSSGDSDIYG